LEETGHPARSEAELPCRQHSYWGVGTGVIGVRAIFVRAPAINLMSRIKRIFGQFRRMSAEFSVWNVFADIQQ
jgi:hypothetical protein